MTNLEKAQFNRDYKRLYRRIERIKKIGGQYFDDEIEKEKRNFRELWQKDREFKFHNRDSLLIFIELNRMYRVQPLHMVFPDMTQVR